MISFEFSKPTYKNCNMKLKGFCLFLICLSFSYLVKAQSYYPSIDGQDELDVKIIRVDKNLANTIIRFKYINSSPKEHYILLNPPNNGDAYFIQSNGIRFNLLKTEGIANKDEVTIAYPNKSVMFSAYFEPLPSSITKFDLIEGANGTWHFYGIDLSKQNNFSGKSKTVANERKKAEPISRNKRETTTPDLSVPYLMYVISPADFTDVNGTNLITLPVGTPLEVLNEENDYYKVRNNGYIGYVNRYLLGDTKKQPDRYLTPDQLVNSSTQTRTEEVKVLYPSLHPTDDEEEQKLDKWLNESKEHLIKRNGPPAKISTDGKGGEIYTYEATYTTTIAEGSSYTIHNDGKYVLPQYKDVTFDTPATRRQVTHSNMFFIDKDGIIYYWLIKDR